MTDDISIHSLLNKYLYNEDLNLIDYVRRVFIEKLDESDQCDVTIQNLDDQITEASNMEILMCIDDWTRIQREKQ